jgi:hypothetical protein
MFGTKSENGTDFITIVTCLSFIPLKKTYSDINPTSVGPPRPTAAVAATVVLFIKTEGIVLNQENQTYP